MIRWGFIGCGQVTERKSGPAFAKAEGSAIEAVMSRDKGMICFSIFTFQPIALHDSEGRHEFDIPNPEHVQFPLVQAVVDHLNGKSVCSCDGISATPTNWVIDRILGKF